MEHRSQGHAACGVRKHIWRVGVHDAVDIGKALVHLAVDVPLDVATRGIGVDRGSIADLVGYEVGVRRDKGGRPVAGHDEVRCIVWGANRDVAVGVNYGVVVEDVVRRDECC